MVDLDIVITGGTVIDPANDVNSRMDLGISDGKIHSVGTVSPGKNTTLIDATDRIVVPGLIDLHTHLYKDVSMMGVEADALCPRTGVTTAVDAGTAGWINYPGLERYIIRPSTTRILAYVNLGAVGIPWKRNELKNNDYIMPDECAKAVREHQDTALGVKVRLNPGIAGERELTDVLDLALEAANQCDKPLMVHLNNNDLPLPCFLKKLRPGDVLTHCFRGGAEMSLVDGDGKILSAVHDARDNGVIFDIGHGLNSFSFDQCKLALDAGFFPDTISSDIHALCIHGPVYDLPTTMSKFLAFGMSLEEIIRRTTHNPAKAIGLDKSLGRIEVGAIADVAVLQMEDGVFSYADAGGDIMNADLRLRCRATVKGGKIIWDDLPDSALKMRHHCA